jgi:hypothetical protein
MSLHSPSVDRSGLSNVEAISPPVTAASRSMPSKSACSIDTTPASVNICDGDGDGVGECDDGDGVGECDDGDGVGECDDGDGVGECDDGDYGK